jgi:hypothetical protein
MDTDHPRWTEYQQKFEELALLADPIEPPAPPLDTCTLYLCLYGENGLPAEEEFKCLQQFDDAVGENLKKVTVETPYWEDTVLFIP